jgi:hypothetical protein
MSMYIFYQFVKLSKYSLKSLNDINGYAPSAYVKLGLKKLDY